MKLLFFYRWGEGEEPDVGMLASRKSSSSTDCSSCYSLHSRTSTSGSDVSFVYSNCLFKGYPPSHGHNTKWAIHPPTWIT